MIKNIHQLDAGLFTDAFKAAAVNGLAYVDLNAHLLDMAAKGDFEDGMIREDLVRLGISPVRQLLHHAGIRLDGLSASTCGVFFRGSADYVPGADVLVPMLAQEIFENALGIQAGGGDLVLTSSPGTAGGLEFALDNRAFTDQRLPIPENVVSTDDLVSATFGINSDGYRSGRITQDQRGEQNEMGRVAEGADFPLYILDLDTRQVRIYKRGARVKWTYEHMRRVQINKLALILQEIAFSEDLKRRKDALAVAANGDGNGNGMVTSATHPATWTAQALDEFGMDVAWNSSLGMNMYVGDLTEVKGIRALRYANGGYLTPDQLAMYNGGGGYQMPDGSALKLAPKGSVLDGAKTVLGWNTARGLEQVVENGSQIQEQERIISNQTGQLVVSINLGFGKPFDNSFQAMTRS